MSALPRLSVCPSIRIFLMPGFAFSSSTISPSIGKLSGRMVADAGLEVHLLEHADRRALEVDELRAAVLLRIGIGLTRLLRAGVLRVGDAVLVGVVLRAAVLVVDAVLVLGLVRALVELVGDAVAVAIARRRAAVARVGVLVVLGLGRAGVDVVGNAVAVGVLQRLVNARADLRARRRASAAFVSSIGTVRPDERDEAEVRRAVAGQDERARRRRRRTSGRSACDRAASSAPRRSTRWACSASVKNVLPVVSSLDDARSARRWSRRGGTCRP